MLGIVLDIGCGYLVAKYVKHMWLAILAAVIGGIVIAFGVNMLMPAEALDPATADEIMNKIASGIMLNPLVILTSLIVFRRRNENALKENVE